MVSDEDGGGWMDVKIESKSGLDCMAAQGPEGDYWKVAVVPSAAFEHLPHARLPRTRGPASWESDEEVQGWEFSLMGRASERERVSAGKGTKW